MTLLEKEYSKYLPSNKSWKNGIFSAIIVLLVFLLFQPFGFKNKDLALKLILFPAYSLLAYFYSVFNFILVRHILKSKKTWTLKNEILIRVLGILPFTFFIYLLSTWVANDMPLNLHWYLKLLYHVSSLFLMITIVEFFYYRNTAADIEIEYLSHQIHLVSQQRDSVNQNTGAEIVSITLEKATIDINRNKIFFIKSVGNYLEFYFRDANGQISKLLKRGRIHQVEKDLDAFPEFIRSHRAFIVNLKQVKQIKGNSKNAKIVFDQNLEEIPVSRLQVTRIKEQLDKIITG